MTSTPLHALSALEIAAAVRAGELGAEEVVSHHLDRIEERADLHALITVVDRAEALAAARRVPRDGRLAGVPFAPKDLLDTAGLRTTYGSRIFADHVPRHTASTIQRCLDEGAVLVGKANLHEFAWGVTSQNVWHGRVVNPRHPGLIPGGSSGGSAAAVAAGLVPLTLGTDTGGSIRIPAAACGIAGIKPSFGLISNDGCQPLAADMDTIGPMCRTLAECAVAFEVLGGPAATPQIAGLRVGVIHPVGVEQAIAGLGAHVEEAELPDSSHLLAWFAAKAAAGHAEPYLARRDDYSPDLQRKMDAGRSLSAVDFLHLDQQAVAWRRLCEQTIHHDVLVCPTIPVELPPADVDETGEVRLRLTRYTRPFNILGWASVTTRDGLEWSGRDDATVLGAALAWEASLTTPVEIA